MLTIAYISTDQLPIAEGQVLGYAAGRRGGKAADDDDYEDEEEEEGWEPGRKRKAALKSKARYRELSGK